MEKVDLVDMVDIVENMVIVGGPGGQQSYVLFIIYLLLLYIYIFYGEMDQVVIESNRSNETEIYPAASPDLPRLAPICPGSELLIFYSVV